MIPDTNDFLRPCNCVHPTEEDCERCIQESECCLPIRAAKPAKAAAQKVPVPKKAEKKPAKSRR